MQEINETLHKLIDEGKKNIVIDMSDVSLVTSSGIGIMISAYTTMKNSSGNIRFCNYSDKVHGVLAITKLDKVFDYFNSVDEALKSFN
jgi:anti-sigma B factor antagonist